MLVVDMKTLQCQYEEAVKIAKVPKSKSKS